MTNHCPKCGKFVSSSDSLKCHKCCKVYHRQCAKVNTSSRGTSKWVCSNCSKLTDAAANESPMSNSSGSAEEGLGGALQATLAQEMRLLRTELSSVCKEMAGFRNEVSKLNTNISEFNKRLDSVEERVNNIEIRLSRTESHTISSPGIDVADEIRTYMNKHVQEAFSNDVEIIGIAEQSDENPSHLVSVVAQNVGVTLDPRDVVFSERRGKPQRRGDGGGDAGGAARGPRPLVVRFVRRSTRDQLLRAARTRREADAAGAVPGAEPRRVYINERLTQYNRNLFYEVRKAGRCAGWKFIWVRNGNVYARRDEGLKSFWIKSQIDMRIIFDNSFVEK